MSLSKLRQRIGKGPDRIDLSAKQAGQILVIFALMLTVLIGLVGIAIDVTYAWRNGLQIQRAADAAAMAGVVYLPGAVTTGHDKAVAIAGANGYPASTVTAAPTSFDTRKMDVTITADVPTFFVNLFGVNHWTISRSARAAYIMPVPLGSPLAYYGVGCLVLQSVSPKPPCNATGTGQSGVTTAGITGGTPLASLGAFGAVLTKGGNQENGDAYLPDSNGSLPNYSYDPRGYYYTVVLPSTGDIKIFDPGFCAMGPNGAGGSYGTGDHWIGTSGTPVSTYFNVLDTHDVPLNPAGWTTTSWSSGNTFTTQKGYDPNNLGTGGIPGGSTNTCDSYHNAWYTLASGVPAGTYEVQVTTTNLGDASINNATNAENMWAILATAPGSQVYGYDKMALYNNLTASGVSQMAYLAKVDQITGKGKTLTIDLFDVGDSTAGYIRIWSPDQSATQQVLVNNFSYFTYNINSSGSRVSPGNCVAGLSDFCSDYGRSKITVRVASASNGSFNNTWLEITIPLGPNYGNNGLWQGGWWQVEYVVSAGNDTTTWSVNVNGNPVHLEPIP